MAAKKTICKKAFASVAVALFFLSGFALDFTDVEAGLRYTYSVGQNGAAISRVYRSGALFNGRVAIPEALPDGGGDPVPVVELQGGNTFWGVPTSMIKEVVLPPTLIGLSANTIDRLYYLERLEMPLWLAIEAAQSGGVLANWHPYLSPTNSCLELVTTSHLRPQASLPVCELPMNAFSNLRYVDTIELPPTVQTVSAKAFYGCSRLRRVLCDIAPEDLTPEFYASADMNWQRWMVEGLGFSNPTSMLRSVGASAFAGCKNLQEVELPPCIERISQAAFSGCTALRRIAMPKKLKVLGHHALAGLSSLEEVSFGTNLVMIGQSAFMACSSLRHVKLPESVIALPSSSASLLSQPYTGDNPAYRGARFSDIFAELVDPDDSSQMQFAPASLFANCTSLETVELGGYWHQTLPYSMFMNCTSLTNVVLPSMLSSPMFRVISSPVFRNCMSLEQLLLPDAMTTINTNAFIGCPNMKRVKLPVRMTSIIAKAFKGMVSFEVVALPPNLMAIQESAFEGCSSLNALAPWGGQDEEFAAFADEVAAAKEAMLPSSVRTIGRRAFWGCIGLERVIFPDRVGLLAEDVFEPDSRVSVSITPSVRKTELFGNGKVRVLSAEMSKADPGKMVVRYEVVSSNAMVRVYPLAFAGDERSFAHVIRPAALENVESNIAANEERTLVWDIGADLGTDFAGTIRFGFVSDAGKAGTGTSLDGLFWQYAKDAAGLTLSQGVLRAGDTVLANGETAAAAAAGYLAGAGVAAAAIIHGESKSVNVRLVTHRFAKDVLIDGEMNSLFSVPGADVGTVFAGAVTPIAADVNGDGLFDMIVAASETTNTFLNVGTAISPEFRTALPSLAAGAVANPATLADYPAIEAALRNGGVSAEGLNVVVVDWDGDGGEDAICGTADGRLYLLADQSIGRPSGLAGEFSPMSVNLSWNSVAAPSVRGYRVYRSVGRGGETTCLEEPFTVLPRFTDSPPALGVDYWYRVSAVSRRYVAGNSEPEYVESDMSDPVYGMFGRVELMIPDMTVSTNGTAEVVLSILNTMDLSGNGGSFTFSYDPSVLTPLKANAVGTTGLSSALQVFAGNSDSDLGEWKVTTQGGKCPSGGGAFLRIRFDVASESATTTTVAVTEASMKVAGNDEIEVDIMPVEGRVIILPPASATQDGVPPYSLGDVDGSGILDEADVRLLAKLKSAAGRKYTAAQLRAGDFNGNGKLDNADYQALRALLKEKGIL